MASVSVKPSNVESLYAAVSRLNDYEWAVSVSYKNKMYPIYCASVLSLLVTDSLNHFDNLLFAPRYGSIKDFHVAVYNLTLEVLYLVLNVTFSKCGKTGVHKFSKP